MIMRQPENVRSKSIGLFHMVKKHNDFIASYCGEKSKRYSLNSAEEYSTTIGRTVEVSRPVLALH